MLERALGLKRIDSVPIIIRLREYPQNLGNACGDMENADKKKKKELLLRAMRII